MKNFQSKSPYSEQDSEKIQKKNRKPSQNKTTNSREPSPNNHMSSKKHNLFRQSLYLGNAYMKTFIKKHSKDSFKCLKCKDDMMKKTGKEYMWCENLYSHISSESHKTNTPKSEQNKLKELLEVIRDRYQSKDKTKSQEENDGEKDIDTTNYLQFIAFLVAQRLSYSQIAQTGKFLQKLEKENSLSFLGTHYFDEEVISKIVSDCFRPALKEELHNNLLNSKYSLSIDTSTMVGQNICVLRAKYLKEKEEDGTNLEELQNRIIAISALKDSSRGEALFEIVNEKIFMNNEIIKENLIGLTHDNANSLSGEDNGLIGLIRKERENFVFDLADPCHCVSLALKHSLKAIPAKVMNFVDNIHNYFFLPSKKAKLLRIQEEKLRPKLLLKDFVETRWLSLGQSLERMLKMWDSKASKECLKCGTPSKITGNLAK